jgi:hypothetical protein
MQPLYIPSFNQSKKKDPRQQRVLVPNAKRHIRGSQLAQLALQPPKLQRYKTTFQKTTENQNNGTGQSNDNPSLPPGPPGNRPNPNSNPHTSCAPHSPEPKAAPAMALAIAAAGAAVSSVLVSARIDKPPHRGPNGGKHSDDPPIRAEVLDAPDD